MPNTGAPPPDGAPADKGLICLTPCRDHPSRWYADLRLDPEAGYVRLMLCSGPALLRERMQDLSAQAEAAAHQLLAELRHSSRDMPEDHSSH